MKLMASLPFVLPIFTGLLSIPMAFGLIAPNDYYGYRTATSLSTADQWYSANATAGWIGIAASILALAVNAYIFKAELFDARHRATICILLFGVVSSLSSLVQFGINR